MVFRKPIPQPLPTAFSVADAYAHGFSRAQLRNRSLLVPFHGTRALALPTSGEPQAEFKMRCRALATRMPSGAAFSHRTAAILHQMPLPGQQTNQHFEVTVPAPGRAIRRRGVDGHCSFLAPDCVGTLAGIPVTTVERTWCDLATMLSLPDLVAVADFLLWHRNPRTTIARLTTAVGRHPSRSGRPALRSALTLASDHSQSRPESLVRVDLALSDLPTPVANLELHLVITRRVVHLDLAYPEYKLELEYHGDQHRTDVRQWRSDVRRANDIGDEGWQTLQFTGDDLADLPSLRRRVERRLRSLGWDG
ncbi:hypothetical protein IWX78_000349 [Mycetocola sp. CAN_C7]|uniref:hypothetical protein n=1 Tax=Mycetocola sp. CAN_C7 TaxID=2787724 RepID=UPI0018C9CB07